MKCSCFTFSPAPSWGGLSMKSSAALAVLGIFSCILLVCCGQITQPSERNPPDTTYQVGSFEFGDNGTSQKVRSASVTAAFFQGAKIVPLLGRGFLPVEYDSRRTQVVMLSQRFWQQQFGGDPRIIGKTMRLNGQTFTVIGIMPTTFDVPS